MTLALQPALPAGGVAVSDGRDPRCSVSQPGSLLLFPQAVDAWQKSLDCFLQRNGSRKFYGLLLGLHH